MSKDDILNKDNFQDYPSFHELSDLRSKIHKDLIELDESFDEDISSAFVDSEVSKELYDLHTQITSITGLVYLDELFHTMDINSHTHHADFIEGLQDIINSTEDYDDSFFVELDDYEWDFDWNDRLRTVRKKLNTVSLDNRLELLVKLRKQVLRRLDKAFEFWGKPKERLSQILTEPKKIINFINHYLLVQSFENYDISMIFSKQLRTYIKSRPFFPLITLEDLFSEITRLIEIAIKHGFNDVAIFLESIFNRFFILS